MGYQMLPCVSSPNDAAHDRHGRAAGEPCLESHRVGVDLERQAHTMRVRSRLQRQHPAGGRRDRQLLDHRHDLLALDREYVAEPPGAAQQHGGHPDDREHRVHEVAGTQKGDAAGEHHGPRGRCRELDAVLSLITHADALPGRQRPMT